MLPSVHFNVQFGTSLLKIEHVQRFWIYSVFVDNSLQFSESVHLLYQLMWHIPCSSSISIDNTNGFKSGERSGHTTGSPRLIHLSWKRLVKWRLTLTRKWAGASTCMNHIRCLCCKRISPKSSNKLFFEKIKILVLLIY